MSRRVGVAVLLMVGLLAAGLIVVWINRVRADQDRTYCANNLRMLAQASEQVGLALPAGAAAGVVAPAMTAQVPPGTVVNPALPPEDRLSWVVPLLPLFDQRLQDTASVYAQIDLSAPWDAERHAAPARERLTVLRCLGNPPEHGDGPAVTQYVGAGGVGPDAATLPLTLPPAGWPPIAPPRAGCFRYDAPTPYAAITDGLSHSILFAEVSAELGPWLRGGPATVRTLDDGLATRAIGTGGQFGGNHPGGANFAFADHSVRFLTDRTDPEVLKGLFTIAGGAADPLPGD
jgi:prepilin-type processing-associated H-X9-DG protein